MRMEGNISSPSSLRVKKSLGRPREGYHGWYHSPLVRALISQQLTIWATGMVGKAGME
jgi:hypothetical protein